MNGKHADRGWRTEISRGYPKARIISVKSVHKERNKLRQVKRASRSYFEVLYTTFVLNTGFHYLIFVRFFRHDCRAA